MAIKIIKPHLIRGGVDQGVLKLRIYYGNEISGNSGTYPTYDYNNAVTAFGGEPDVFFYENASLPGYISMLGVKNTHKTQDTFQVNDVLKFSDTHTVVVTAVGASIGLSFRLNGSDIYSGPFSMPRAVVGMIGSWSEASFATFPWRSANNSYVLSAVFSGSTRTNGYSTHTNRIGEYTSLINWFNLAPEPEDPDLDPNSEIGNSEEGGGKGSHMRTSKLINPYSPARDILDAGFMTLFAPTKAQIQSLASYMWSPAFDLATLKKMFADPMDVIIGCHMLPFTVTTAGSKEIKVAGFSTGVTANYCNKQSQSISFGTLKLDEFWGSCLDYAPYTKVDIFLPYIGMRSLDTDEVMGQTLGLTYEVDLLTGACVAQIAVGGSVLYEFTGNCAQQIPISGSDYSGAIAGALTAAAAIGVAVATGGAGTGAAGAAIAGSETAAAGAGAGITAATIGAAHSTANAVLSAKPNVERGGSLAGAAGFLGEQQPYIIVKYPRQSLAKNYMKYNGYPCNMSFTLGSLNGFTQCETVRVHSERATDEELQEITAYLQSGVILGGTPPTKPTALSGAVGVTLYRNTSPQLKVNKNLTQEGTTQSCTLKRPCDMSKPTIELSGVGINFNYVYIDIFDRYYYVVERRSVRAGVWELELKCDTLQSFASDIGAADAIVSRQEEKWNLYLDDGSFKVYSDTEVYVETFSGVGFNSGNSFILIVAGSD